MNRPTRRRSTKSDSEFPHSPDFCPRDMCFLCLRPTEYCYCKTIPSIDNRTELLLVQHIRERSHPFNTARMVGAAMNNVVTIVDYAESMPNYDGSLRPKAGLLYPSSTAKLLDDIAPDARPNQLIVLDGTWHHTKRLFKCWPKLGQLPHYRLAPNSPGQYRIRLEPNEHSLSTVEAVVAAYQVLEPSLEGLDELLQCFQNMVARQLAHPRASYRQSSVPRSKKVNIPRALLHDYHRLIVAYGEAAPGLDGKWHKRTKRPPVYWVAKRLSTGEKFSCFIEPPTPIESRYLQHFGLLQCHFENTSSIDQFHNQWSQFIGSDDILVVYNDNTLRLLKACGGRSGEAIALKSIEFDPDNRFSTLGEMFTKLAITPDPIEFPGRAGLRVRNAATLVKYLKTRLLSME